MCQCKHTVPPWLQGQRLTGFWWARGNEAHRKAWMPVVNHPETHLSWPRLRILCTREGWQEDENWYSSLETFLPVGEILMRQAWKTHCVELGTAELKKCSPRALNFHVPQNTRECDVVVFRQWDVFYRSVSKSVCSLLRTEILKKDLILTTVQKDSNP